MQPSQSNIKRYDLYNYDLSEEETFIYDNYIKLLDFSQTYTQSRLLNSLIDHLCTCKNRLTSLFQLYLNSTSTIIIVPNHYSFQHYSKYFLNYNLYHSVLFAGQSVNSRINNIKDFFNNNNALLISEENSFCYFTNHIIEQKIDNPLQYILCSLYHINSLPLLPDNSVFSLLVNNSKPSLECALLHQQLTGKPLIECLNNNITDSYIQKSGKIKHQKLQT